jgi:hypothetical protein
MSRLNVWPWLRPFIILVLVICIPPLLYWFGYVQHSVQAAKQQAYITLSAVATNFRDRLAAHDQIAATAERMAARQPERLKGYLESVLQPKSTLSISAATTHLEVGKTSGGLYLNVGRIPNVARPRADAIRCGAAAECSIRAVVPLENLIPWNAVETEFDGLLVLSEDKRLLAQDRRLPTQPLGVVVPLQSPTSAVIAKDDADNKSAPAAAPGRSLRSPVDFSDQASIELAGIEYIAFTQEVLVVVTPVGLAQSADAASEPATLTFTVCALVAKDRLRREALELSPQTLILIAALVALGLFAIPFLKLRFIGARERMHPRDIWLLASSLLCATALLVLVILDAHTLVKLRDRFDAGLFQFSRSVQSHLRAETRSAIEQLQAVAPELLQAPAAVGGENAQAPQCEFHVDASAAAAIAPQSAVGAALTSARSFTYPDFEAAFATDLCGYQIRKQMPRTIPTPSISVDHESYFPETLALAGPAAPPFVHSAIIAPTSGLPLGIYAMPLDATTLRMGPEVGNRSGIIVMATPMRSVNFPVVPEPFQFVLVNRQGEVTFQQAQGPFRGERFFDSVAGGAALERLARTPGSSDRPTAGSYQYRGQTYRMSAVDLPDLQLTLVSYYDQSVIGLVTARVFATTATFVVGIIVSMLAGAALAVCWFGKTALDWAWPTPSRTLLYFMGSGLCILAMSALLVARHLFTSYWLIWFMLAAPAVIMFVLGSGRVVVWLQWLATKLRLGLDASKRRRPRLTSLAFQSFAVTAILAFVAWPTSIVFNDAFTLHASAYASGVERNWNISKDKWWARLQGPVTNVGEPLPSQNCDVHADLRCTVPDRIYASQVNYDALTRMRNAHGVYDDCANLRSASGECATDMNADAVPASFTVGTAYRLARMGRANTDLAQTLAAYEREQGQSKRAPLLEGFGWTRWNLGGFALLIGAMSLLVGSISKHILGVGLTNDLVLDEHDQFERKDGTRWLLLRPSSSVLAGMGGPNVTQIDLRDLQLVPQLTQPPPGAVLCIQHLERRLSDKQWRDALLALLNTDTPGCLVFTSEIDPLYYLTQRSREKEDYLRSLGHEDSPRRKEAEEDSRDLRNELAHWGVALREMRKIRQVPAPFPDIPVTAERVAVRDRLVEECAGIDPPLIEIGARLLRRPDLTAYRWDEIVGFVLDAAEPYYRAMWELCSREERLVLIQLAQEGLVNPRRVELVRRLARRGLVRFHPRLRLMNESFQRFVRTVEAPERIAEWERTTEGMSWSRLGTPLYALAAVIIAILLFTEQAMITSVLAIATGAAGTLGSLRSLYAATKPANPAAKVV